MTESTMPRVAQLQTQTGLEPEKLKDAARSKLQYARAEYDRILREYGMKRAEIEANARERLEALRRETDDAMDVLTRSTIERAAPAREMIALVEKMLR